MRKLMARVVLRSALAISAVGIVAAVGAFDGGPSGGAQEASGRPGTGSAAVQPAGWAAADPAAADPEPASSYSLKTQNGPRAALAARIVTATLLLTGLVLTALGAIGMRGPSLARRRPAAEGALEPVDAPASVPRPGGHPRFGPPPT
ncbi:MAG: hypothetical protein HOV68_00375 [Streptomycetaceae bacterium]|nr:hypothetical protein [Streptomycetaceae bacterium]